MKSLDAVRWTSVMAAVAGLGIGLPQAVAQQRAPAPLDPLDIALRATATPSASPIQRFANERFGLASVPGGILMQGERATAWTERVNGRPVQRVLLEGRGRGIRLEIGNSAFEAQRAVLWIRRLDDGSGARQVFAVLEHVGSRAGVPSQAADELTVSGVITGEVRLVADLVSKEPPSGDAQLASLKRADELLDNFFNPPPPEPEPEERPFSRVGRLPVPMPEPTVIVRRQAPAEPAAEADETEAPAPVVQEQRPSRPAQPTPPAQPRQPVIVRDGERPTQPADPAKPGERVAERPAERPVAPGMAEVQPEVHTQDRIPPDGRVVTREPVQPGAWRPAEIWPPPVPEARVRDQIEPGRGSAAQPTAIGQDVGGVILPGSGPAGLGGVLTFSAEDIAIVAGNGESQERTVLLSGGVSLELSKARDRQGLLMTAQRAVIFLTPGAIADLGQVDRSDVLGVYLEGEAVVQDDRYTQRGSSLYYDVQGDRALVLDAVLHTFEPRLGTPLYVRANSIRREGERQFVAERASVANTSFAKPHFAVGSREVVVERYQREVGGSVETGNMVDAKNVTIDAGSTPIFWWPKWSGDPERVPLRGLAFDSSGSEGVAVKTTWDAWVLAGIEPPEGLGTDLLVDVYEKRGLGLGGIARWGQPSFTGNVFGYILPNDTGVDRLRTGEEFDQDGRVRGVVLAENRWDIDRNWTLRLEGAHVSDQRLLESVFDEDFRDRREITTRGVLTRRGENTLFEFETAQNQDDFLSNQYLLLSQGYSVDRLPEIRFTQLTVDPLADFAPGLIVYDAEVRAGMLGLNFDDVTASSRGFRGDALSQQLFGINANDSIADRLRSEGFNEKPIWRFDTRHQFSMPMQLGDNNQLNVTPFVVGRLTSYDSNFSGFSPEEEDKNRLWGAAGVRLASTLSNVYESVESRTLDLHRLRHVIEPAVTIWHGGSSIDRVNLPVYDDEVESLAEGTIIRVGLDQRWQTQRGGPGRWRNVDVLTLRAEWVWSSSDVDEKSPIGRFYENRPELSNPGEFYNIEALWQVSDALGLAGRVVHDIDDRKASYATAGVIVDHGADFRTTLDVRRVEAIDATVVGASAAYQVTPKYRVSTFAQYDTVEDDFENVSASVDREFPNVVLRGTVRYDNVRGETSFGFLLTPVGVPSGGFGFAGVGGSDGNRSVAR